MGFFDSFKPDGTSILNIAGGSNIGQGLAQVISNVSSAATAVVNLGSNSSGGQSYFSDDGDILSSIVKTFSLERPAGGPPFPNILEQFASYAPLWTMAALTPNQFNNPNTYRGIPGALQHIVFSSAGRFDGQRVQTYSGAPEYYVDNFDFITTVGASPAAGNSNVQTISFDLYEPYSMGLFLESCAAAAIQAGYPTYNSCPFVLKLEFKGYTQDGAILGSNEILTKYFVVQLRSVDFTVTEGGSQYKVTAHPFNHAGYSNVVDILPNDVSLKIDPNAAAGDTLKAILSEGNSSLVTALNKIQLNRVAEKQQALADEYQIVFPVDWSDTVGLGQESIDDGLAIFNPVDFQQIVSAANPSFSFTENGDGEIGSASLGFDANTGGNYNFGLAADVVDPATGVITRDALTIDPKQRTFTFKQKTPITQVLAQMVLSSNYAKNAIDPKNLDANGMIKWFRLDVQINLGDFDIVRGERQKKYVYRIMPYLVHNSVFANATSAPPGYTNLKKILAKEYNYIFTGQNNDILKYEIKISNLFHKMKALTPPQQNDSLQNKDTQTPTDDPDNEVAAEEGGSSDSLAASGATPVLANSNASRDPTKGGWGAKTIEQIVATNLYNAIVDNGGQNGDLVKINFEIIGDPYYIVDQGMGNYLGQAYGSQFNQITSDFTMNYQGSDAFINIVFRTPVEPNLGITGPDGSLYKFPYQGSENPFSGIYKIVKVTNRFQNGVFTQQLECNRMPKQPNDYPEGYKPTIKAPFIFGTPTEGSTKDSVSESAGGIGIDLRTPEEIQASEDLGDFFG